MAFREIYTKQDIAIRHIGVHCRKFIRKYLQNNHAAILTTAFNDAMTYNPETGKGGAVFGYKFNSIKAKKFNKPHWGFLEEFVWMKQAQADFTFDPFSNSDYLQSYSIVSIKDTGGPDLTEYHKIGRQDVQSEEDVQYFAEVPDPDQGASAFRDPFYAKGFEDRELVALSMIYTFGKYKSHYEKTYTTHPVFGNSYFKYLINEKEHNLFSLDKILLGDDALKEVVEEFATDKKAFFETFTDAYLKLHTLGNDENDLYLEINKDWEY